MMKINMCMEAGTSNADYFIFLSADGLGLAVSVYHEDFDLVNIFDMLPAELKSEEPQDYFNDAGI